MKKTLFIIAILALSLGACSSSSSYSFDQAPDESKTYLLNRNGNLIDYSGDSTYQDVSVERESSAIILSAEAGESCLFVFASSSCSHCVDFESSYASYVIHSEALVTLIYDTGDNYGTYKEEATALASYFPSSNSSDTSQQITGETPTMFLGKKGSLTVISWGSNDESYLRHRIDSVSSFTNIYEFSSASAFINANKEKSDVLSFVYDSSNAEEESIYRTTVYPLAKKSAKRLYLVDLSRFSDADKTTLLSTYQLSSEDSPILISQTGNQDWSQDASTIKTMLASYYGS